MKPSCFIFLDLLLVIDTYNHVGCERIDCSPGSQCVSDGSGVCVGLCDERVSHCRSDQLCRIQQYNSTFCDPSPCQYSVCYNAPYGKHTCTCTYQWFFFERPIERHSLDYTNVSAWSILWQCCSWAYCERQSIILSVSRSFYIIMHVKEVGCCCAYMYIHVHVHCMFSTTPWHYVETSYCCFY